MFEGELFVGTADLSVAGRMGNGEHSIGVDRSVGVQGGEGSGWHVGRSWWSGHLLSGVLICEWVRTIGGMKNGRIKGFVKMTRRNATAL